MFSPLGQLTRNWIPSEDNPASNSVLCSSTLKSILITDDVLCDADFLVNHFLHSFVKAECPTVFVHATQTFSHYQLVASKCGVNLQSFVDKKTVSPIDGMKLLTDCLSPGAGGDSATDSSRLTRSLFDAIVEAADILLRNCLDLAPPISSLGNHHPSKRLLVLIDDFTLLSSLGVSARHLAAFVYCLRRRFSSLPVTLVSRLHDDVEDEIDDEKDVYLAKLFARQVDAHFHVRGLSTGYCRDVHGAIDMFEKLNVAGGNKEPTSATTNAAEGCLSYFKKTEKQFKIGEKSVSIFAPGLSTAVL